MSCARLDEPLHPPKEVYFWGQKSLPYFATFFSLMITLLLGKLLPSASCLGPFLKTQYSSVSSTGTSRGRGQVFINSEMFSKDSSAFFSFLGQLQADGKVGHETEGVRGDCAGVLLSQQQHQQHF